MPQYAVAGPAGKFGFSQDKAFVVVRDLSGGERARLNLALVTHDAPALLILDEPTNHLDIEAREALVQAATLYEKSGDTAKLTAAWETYVKRYPQPFEPAMEVSSTKHVA